MSEAKERREIGRRGFLGLIGLTAAVLGGKEVIDRIYDAKHDLSNPENFREFVGKDVYPAYFKGSVYVREGAVLRSRPTYFQEGESEFPFTTPYGGDTEIASVGGGDEFKVKNPLLIFHEAMGVEDNYYIKQIKLPDGTSKKIDIRGSWIVFGSGLSPNMSQELRREVEGAEYKVACVNFTDLAFQPNGVSEPQFSFPEGSIEYRQVIELGTEK